MRAIRKLTQNCDVECLAKFYSEVHIIKWERI